MPTVTDDLRYTEWAWISAENGRTPLLATRPTLKFSPSGVSGFAVCNEFSGSYERDGNELEVTMMSMNLLGCQHAPGGGELENWFFSAVASMQSYQIEGDELLLLTEEGEMRFVSAQNAPPPCLNFVACVAESWAIDQREIISDTAHFLYTRPADALDWQTGGYLLRLSETGDPLDMLAFDRAGYPTRDQFLSRIAPTIDRVALFNSPDIMAQIRERIQTNWSTAEPAEPVLDLRFLHMEEGYFEAIAILRGADVSASTPITQTWTFNDEMFQTTVASDQRVFVQSYRPTETSEYTIILELDGFTQPYTATLSGYVPGP